MTARALPPETAAAIDAYTPPDVPHDDAVEYGPQRPVRAHRRGVCERCGGPCIIDTWPSWSERSPHLERELEAVAEHGPLAPGQPVPRCGCEACTGIPARPARPRRPRRDLRPALDLDRARAVPVSRVAAALGLEVNGRGWARCPFHDDANPSLHLNDRKGRAFCNPCGRSWDALGLARELRGLSFPDAVRAVLEAA